MAILIVDDAEDMRLLLTSILNGGGYRDLITADSAEEAFTLLGIESDCRQAGEPLRSAQIQEIDLIMMDVAMHDMDGIEACRRIKEVEAFHDIPVIMVTAMDDMKLLDLAFETGAHDYIAKPFNKVELLSRVRSTLRLKDEIDQKKRHEEDLTRLTEELKQANSALKELSFLDGMTGIANRRYFDKQIHEEWRREKRHGEPLSFIMIDIDFFKPYNDLYGHLSGDDCLKKVAAELKSSLGRPGDFVARYGGEEFSVLLPETTEEGAIEIAEKLRMNVESLQMEHAKSAISDVVTISLGVATVTTPFDVSSSALIASADKALYRAKKGGRNRVEAAL